jgi:uncharacterized protein (DUF885 family)
MILRRAAFLCLPAFGLVLICGCIPPDISTISTPQPSITSVEAEENRNKRLAVEPVSNLQNNVVSFMEDSFEQLLLRDPELLIETGLYKEYSDLPVELTDISEPYQQQTRDLEQQIYADLMQFDRDVLLKEDQISFDVFTWYLEDRIQEHDYVAFEYPVTHFIIGAQYEILNFFTEIHPLANEKDAEDYINRLNQVGQKFNQLGESLLVNAQAGTTAPGFILEWSLRDIERIANSSPRTTAYFLEFSEKLSRIKHLEPAERNQLEQEAEKAIRDSVLPGYRELADVISRVLPQAADHDGVWQFEGGDAYYRNRLRHFTTTSLDPSAIHKMGIAELDRIHSEMREIFDNLGYPKNASLTELYNQAAIDGGTISPADVVLTYEEIIHQAENNLTEAFDIFPQADVRVEGVARGGYYIPGSLDGSRLGVFYATDSALEPRFSMATLAYHETVPGHHFQISIAQESDLPLFRNILSFTGYTEGWALYAEKLASEFGWYSDDPYGDLGRLQAEAFRAARLVVDTGIHSKQWTYDQAVDFMFENTGLPREMVNFEVSRYIAWPGQSTAYMIGLLNFMELRQKAENELGDQFDLKQFHNAVLQNGSMPLEVLENVVDAYIEQSR